MAITTEINAKTRALKVLAQTATGIRSAIATGSTELEEGLDTARRRRDWGVVETFAGALQALDSYPLPGETALRISTTSSPRKTQNEKDVPGERGDNKEYAVLSVPELLAPDCALWETHGDEKRYLTLANLALVFDAQDDEARNAARRQTTIGIRFNEWRKKQEEKLVIDRSVHNPRALALSEDVVKMFLSQSTGKNAIYRPVGAESLKKNPQTI